MSEDSNKEVRVFSVETRFQKMARRAGGVSRDKAIARAEAQIEELKPEFTGWLDRELADLTAAIRHLESHATDSARIDEAYRRCCQLRDVGTTMGFHLVTIISNNVCEMLDAIRTGAAYHKETVDCHLDALLLTSKPPYCHLKADQLPEMTDGLRRLVEQATTPKSNIAH